MIYHSTSVGTHNLSAFCAPNIRNFKIKVGHQPKWLAEKTKKLLLTPRRHLHKYISPFKSSVLTRMAEQMETKTRTAKNSDGGLGPSPSSYRRLNPACSWPRPSTPSSRPTRATCARPCASRTTPSACRPTRLRPSSARSARARASTSPPSCPPPPPAARACRRLRRPSLPRAACYAPVSQSLTEIKTW